MSIKTFKKFIEELREQGISIETLSLLQVKESLNLYKILLENKISPNTIGELS